MPLLVTPASAQGLLPAPSEFIAEWVWPQGTPPAKVKLTWEQPAGTNGSTVYLVERRYGNTDTITGWAAIRNGTVVNVPGSDTLRSITDEGLNSSNMFRHLHYRVRAMSGIGTTATATSGAALISIIGNPTQPSDGQSFDSDADGIPDFVELDYANGKPDSDPNEPADGQNPLQLNDWTDGSGDADGDGVPNAWEFHLSGEDAVFTHEIQPDPTNPNPPLKTRPITHCTVNTKVPVQTTTWPRNYHTITAAINGLPAPTSTHPTNYRIIRVSPGVYEENISINSPRSIAIIPDRKEITDWTEDGQTYPLYNPKGHFEIRGTHATNPVVTIADSHVVMDGFIIGRKPGTVGPVVSVSQANVPVERIYLTRFVNCLFRNNNTGSSAVIEQSRTRLILSHCTFFMNAADNQALGTVFNGGSLSSSFLNSISQTRVHNCIFWNPVNTKIPEYQTAGGIQFISSLVHQRRDAEGNLPPEVPGILPSGIDPYLTPLGYLVGPTKTQEQDPTDPEVLLTDFVNSGAMGLATPNVHVRRDMHGEWRTNEPGKIDLGAHQWADDDYDGIPNFADTLNLWDVAPDSNITDPKEQLEDRIARSAANITDDFDADGISEFQEYLYGTDMQNADTYFLSIHQAVRMFAPLGAGGAAAGSAGLTIQDVRDSFFTKTQSDNRFWRKTDVIRIPQAGDLSMGDYTAGPPLP